MNLKYKFMHYQMEAEWIHTVTMDVWVIINLTKFTNKKPMIQYTTILSMSR